MDRDTSEYSSTKAPETREQADGQDNVVDSRLLPGGAEPKTHSEPGMSALERDPGIDQQNDEEVRPDRPKPLGDRK
jgi:hypothetical protein